MLIRWCEVMTGNYIVNTVGGREQQSQGVKTKKIK